MKSFFALGACCLAWAGFPSDAQATAHALTFDDAFCASAASGVGAATLCGNAAFLNQAYGDHAQVNVTYQGNVVGAPTQSMYYWADGYSGLKGLAYGDNGVSARITLSVLDGSLMKLDGLVLGSWLNVPRNTRFTVTDLGSQAVVFDSQAFQTGGPLPNTFSFNGLQSSLGFQLDFSADIFNVGLDRIDYSLSPIPEPGTWGLLAAGLLGLSMRRRCAVR